MWDIKGDLIQLELGSDVINHFSSTKKKECDLLIKQLGQLRSQLKAINIFLPTVKIRDSSSVQPDEYVLYMGILFYSGNYRQQSPISVLSSLAQQFHTESYTYDNILSIFRSGVNYLVSNDRDYQKAINEFVKTYYCASLGTDTYALMVNSAINICGIQVLNGNLDLAFLDAQRAAYASMVDGFYDPYIKYHSQIWLAIVFVKKSEYANALSSFVKAYQSIKETNASQLKITALWASAYLAALQGDISLSTKALDAIVEILDADNDVNYDKDFYISLMKFRTQISNIQIAILAQELDRLRNEYDRISRKFLYKLGDTALSIVQKAGSVLISTCVGSLLSGSNNFALGDIIYGNEVKVTKGV